MQIEKNRVVTIDYTLKNTDGEVLDTSEGKEPLAYVHGVGALIPGLEDELEGSDPGDKLDVTVEPEKGYGVRQDELVFSLPRERFDEVKDLAVGMQLEATTEDGGQLITVTEVTDTEVTVDANHPLAGETLHFNVSVKSVREATPEEIDHGHVHE